VTQAALPKYLIIERSMRELVANATAGDSLPSEAELSERFAVSRMTARHAVKRLETEGLLYRVPGRGTFATGRRMHRSMGRLRSFSREMRDRGALPSSRVLCADLRAGDREQLASLGLAPRGTVVTIVRLRLADGIPMAIERSVFPAACADLLETDLTSVSLHESLTSLGWTPSRAVGTLVAQSAAADEANLLEVARGAALLVEQRRVFDQYDRPLEATESRYVGDRYVFDVELAGSEDL
jgi:GntR family transcriptional regulator